MNVPTNVLNDFPAIHPKKWRRSLRIWGASTSRSRCQGTGLVASRRLCLLSLAQSDQGDLKPSGFALDENATKLSTFFQSKPNARKDRLCASLKKDGWNKKMRHHQVGDSRSHLLQLERSRSCAWSCKRWDRGWRQAAGQLHKSISVAFSTED